MEFEILKLHEEIDKLKALMSDEKNDKSEISKLQ